MAGNGGKQVRECEGTRQLTGHFQALGISWTNSSRCTTRQLIRRVESSVGVKGLKSYFKYDESQFRRKQEMVSLAKHLKYRKIILNQILLQE